MMPHSNQAITLLWQEISLSTLESPLIQKATGKALVVRNDTLAWAPSNDTHVWRRGDAGDGYFFIVDPSTDKVLDGNGSAAYLSTFNGGAYQKWRSEDTGEGYFKLVQEATGHVLDGNGDLVYMLPWNSGDHQRWSFTARRQPTSP
jgi:hypothetical protein